MKFVKRIGIDPHHSDAYGPKTPAADGCPDVWQLDSGDYAVIGMDVTESVDRPLPDTASCGSDERIVVLPKRLFEAAAADLQS